ncbi:hypothetical protein AB0M23_21385, partial [Streptomyces sp. NPDC052077]
TARRREVPSSVAAGRTRGAGRQSLDNKTADNPVLDAAKPPAQRRPLQDPDNTSNAPARAENTANTAVQGNRDQPRTLPYDDPFYVVRHLHTKMATADFLEGARVWARLLREQHPEEYQVLLLEFNQQEQSST